MMSEFDPIIHPPTRLKLMAVLAEVREAEFAMLREMTEVSDSMLSKHLAALVDAGYVKLLKGARDGRSRTWAAATAKGRAAFRRHIGALTVYARLSERMAAE